jgi:hypothetical protein
MSRKPVDAQATAKAGRACFREALRAVEASVSEVQDGRTFYFELAGPDGELRCRVRIAAKTSGTWQTSTNHGSADPPRLPLQTWWAFVDLSGTPAHFYIADDRTVRQNIWAHHRNYLAQHAEQRPVNPDSTHHAISLARVKCMDLGWSALGLPAAASGV